MRFSRFKTRAIQFLLIAVSVLYSHCQDGSVCTVKPSFPNAARTSYNNGGLFLDLQYPFTCGGYVTAWHFCYYPPPGGFDRRKTYSLKLSVYIRDYPINLIQYIQKANSEFQVQRTGQQLTNHYNCETCYLSYDEQFQVGEGDFIGLYIGHTAQGQRAGDILDIVGSTTGGSSTDPSGGNQEVFWEEVHCQNGEDHTQVGFACLDNVPGQYMAASVDISPTRLATGTAAGYCEAMTTPTSQPSENAPTTTQADSDNNNGQTTTQALSFRKPDTTTDGTYTTTPATNSRNSETTTDEHTTTPASPLTYPETTTEDTDIENNNHSPPDISPMPSTSVVASFNLDYQTQGVPSSTPTLSNTNSTEAEAQRNRLIIIMVVAVLFIVVPLVAVIVCSVVAITLKHKRKAKLELMKWRKERRHVGLDHFVIASDLPSCTSDAMSPPTPQPYEEPLSALGTPSNSVLSNAGAFSSMASPRSNPTYELSNGPDDQSFYSKVDSQRVQRVEYDSQDQQLYGRLENASEHIENEIDAIPPPHIQALYAVVNKDQQRKKSIARVPADKHLYEHYYKTLEEVTTGARRPSEIEEKFKDPASSEKDLYAQFDGAKLNRIPQKEIKIISHLGSGQFGSVSQGTWKRAKGTTSIAVKSNNDSHSTDKTMSRVKLLQEAIIMGQFTNPNVIQFHGMVIAKDTVMLVMELAAKGDLEHLLIDILPDPGELVAPKTSKVMLGFCQQVAFGMHYLSNKGFVHRDIAARNILVTQDNVLKIADFGMSRDLANENYYMSQGGKIPVKWTAPEAIHYQKYSTGSDIWSYGCLLYEIWSLGQIPFRDCSNTEALSKVTTGYRLSPPPGCPRIIYDIMIRCWNPEAQERTPFKTLIFELLEPETKVLHIPQEDIDTHKLASIIGGPLEAGESMYTDLQTRYMKS